MAIAKGRSPILFLIAGAFIVAGAIVYYISESHDGIENHAKAVRQGWIGGILFGIGVIAMIGSYIAGNKKKF